MVRNAQFLDRDSPGQLSRCAYAMLPVSSGDHHDNGVGFSVRPMAARWRVPTDLARSWRVVRGKMAAARRMRVVPNDDPPSWSALFGKRWSPAFPASVRS